MHSASLFANTMKSMKLNLKEIQVKLSMTISVRNMCPLSQSVDIYPKQCVSLYRFSLCSQQRSNFQQGSKFVSRAYKDLPNLCDSSLHPTKKPRVSGGGHKGKSPEV